MKFRKFLATAAASAIAVSAMSVSAFAATEIDVDESKLECGDIEANGKLRIELFNEYGDTKANGAGFDAGTMSFDGGIAVTFTLSGVPAGSYDAFLMFADSSWLWGNWNAGDFAAGETTITGDGTYTVYIDNTMESALVENEDTLELEPMVALGTVVFCVDIAGLGEAAGLTPKEGAGIPADSGSITVSDVKVTTWNADEENPFAGAADVSGDTATNDTTAGDTSADTGAADKGNADTGIEGVAAVAGLGVLAAAGVVVSKKRK